jgi:D-lactate dehydrogenase
MTEPDEALLVQHFQRDEIFISREVLTETNLSNAVDSEVLSVFINSKVDRSLLSRLPRLKLIATRSTGYDHIDLAYCRERGIKVCNVPTYGDNTVAEHTFALILALSRKVIQSHNRAHTGNFSVVGLQGFDLRDRTIGVIGTGHIGVHVIRIARGFMMRVLAFDTRPDKRLADALDFEYTESLDGLLEKSDIVSLHAPLIPATRHLINRKNIQRMKKGALLINTARGGLIETEALISALSSGHLGGAGLDVFEGETLITEDEKLLTNDYDVDELRTFMKNLVLFRHENVVVTPHVAFNSVEALERILTTTVRNILAFENGKSVNLVD